MGGVRVILVVTSGRKGAIQIGFSLEYFQNVPNKHNCQYWPYLCYFLVAHTNRKQKYALSTSRYPGRQERFKKESCTCTTLRAILH